jgi:hypothetical protein
LDWAIAVVAQPVAESAATPASADIKARRSEVFFLMSNPPVICIFSVLFCFA